MAATITEFNSMFQDQNSRPTELFSNYADTMNWSNRLRQAFEDTGWSKAELARRANVPYDSVNKYLDGKVEKPRGNTLKALAAALDIDPIWLEHGTDPSTGDTSVPVMGFVGAGAEVEPDYEQVPPEGIDQVTVPFPLPGDMIAFKVVGSSMMPQFRDGTLIIVFREQHRATETFYGEEAVVRTDDGKRFVKTILRGQRGVTLASWNADPIENVKLEWIGEIFAVLPPKSIRRAVKQGGIQGQFQLKIA